ncbi:hypothetical protein FRAHR75_680009 [Frankia sp. Hr75.2]|nr:hypothetical protein FRAHR75_680009 [Frankia sp. Hr75.2]
MAQPKIACTIDDKSAYSYSAHVTRLTPGGAKAG